MDVLGQCLPSGKMADMIKQTLPRVLAIAGSDPSGGAGIQADIKSCSANGVYAATAITAVVDENTIGVTGVHPIPDSFVAGQIHSVLDDVGADAVKIGMLHSASLIETVRQALDRYPHITDIVLDPVMVATSGDPLLMSDAISTLATRLIPRSRIITPNIPEAEILAGHPISHSDDMTLVARELQSLFPGVAVYLKGGHRDDGTITDVLADGDEIMTFTAPRINTPNTHGTGCTLSSAIAACLAKGETLALACRHAHDYVHQAIAHGARQSVGHGHGPVLHFYNLW